MFTGWQERRFVMPGDPDRELDLEEVPVPIGDARQLNPEYRGAGLLTDS